MADKKEPNVEDKVKEIRPFPKWVSILIVIISLLEVLFIIFLFVISIVNNVSFRCYEKIAESSLLASGIAIIGVAVAVWAGLNIVNAIERKDIEQLKDSYKELQKQSDTIEDSINKTNELSNETKEIENRIEVIERKQKSADNVALLNELYKTNQDVATRVIIEKMRNIKTISNNKLLSLLEIERRFSSVYYLQNSAYSYDSGLLQEAADGISLAKKLLKEELEDSIKHYLLYRIAEFNFYKGYCLKGTERKKVFLKAIKQYELSCKDLGAYLPAYNEKLNYPFKDKEYEKCTSHPIDISAYMCNTIGEAYSKIVEEKKNLINEETPVSEVDDYGKKAIFYCAYASHWFDRETYWRNLGCAIERTYGINKDTPYDDLIAIYKKALGLKATKEAFKTLLSILQKYLAFGFDIGNADPDKGRKTPLNDIKYFDYYSNSISVNKVKMDDMLKELCNYSSKAKTIYPSDTVGYDYSCFYHLYECIINQGNHAEINRHKEQAKEDLQILKILAPNAALTKIFEKDLSVF